jgi:hypothetical protein
MGQTLQASVLPPSIALSRSRRDHITFRIVVPRRRRRPPNATAPNFIPPSSKSILIALTAVNGQQLSKAPSETTNLTNCSAGCTVIGPGGPAGTDTFSLTIYSQLNAAGKPLSTGTCTIQMTTGKIGTATVTLNGIPTLFAFGTFASSHVGTPYANRQPLALSVEDAAGDPIVGSYATAVNVEDSDTTPTSTGTTLALNGGALTRSVVLNSSTDSLTFGYGGGNVGAVTIRAASGTASGNTSFTPSPFSIDGTIYATTFASAGFELTGTVLKFMGSSQIPVGMISGSTSQVSYPGAISLGPGGVLYVDNQHGIENCPCSLATYSSTNFGDVAPLSTISGMTGDIYSLAFDPTGNLYVAQQGSPPSGVLVSDGSGGFTAVRTLGADTPMQIALDKNEAIYQAVYYNGYNGNGYVAQYAAGTTASGVATATITGSATLIDKPAGVAVDTSGYIYVSQNDAAAIAVYAPGSNGNVAPARLLYGANTQLSEPSKLQLDANGFLYVEDETNILVFAPGANGNTAPIAGWSIPSLTSFSLSPSIGSDSLHRPTNESILFRPH